MSFLKRKLRKLGTYICDERRNLKILNSEGDFVKFLGHISEWKDRITLNSQSARIVVDPNEIYFHMLECIQVHLYNTRGPPDITQSNDAMNTSVMDTSMNFGLNFSNIHNPSVTSSSSVVSIEAVMDAIMRTASQVITPNRKRAGVYKSDILEPLMEDYSEEALEAGFNSLLQEGKIFNTLDDDHYTIN